MRGMDASLTSKKSPESHRPGAAGESARIAAPAVGVLRAAQASCAVGVVAAEMLERPARAEPTLPAWKAVTRRRVRRDVETPPAKAPAREEVGRGEVEMRAGMIMRRTSTGNRTVFALYAR